MSKIDAYTKRGAIKTVLLAQLLLEHLDEVKETTLYNGTIKNLTNKLEKALNPFCRRYYDSIYTNDVQNSTDVIDAIIDNIVHNITLDISELNQYNLFILKDKKGNKIKIKTKLTPEEFQKQHNIKLTDLKSTKYGH